MAKNAITVPTPTVSDTKRTYSIPNIAYHKMLFIAISIPGTLNIDARIIAGTAVYCIEYKEFKGTVEVRFNEIMVTTVSDSNKPFTVNYLASFG